MGWNIFDDDDPSKPQPRPASEFAGRFSGGYQEDGKPVALSQWRVSTGKPEVADAIAQLFGGTPVETDSQREEFIDVFTEASSVGVILSGSDAIENDLKLWSNGKLTHHCDGTIFKSHPSKDALIGTPCGCPRLFEDRKQAHKDGLGPAPSIDIRFELADDPELGKFAYHTTSWTMARVLHEYAYELEQIGGEAVAQLALENVSFKAKNGPMAGKTVSYTKPVLNRIRAYNAAITEAA